MVYPIAKFAYSFTRRLQELALPTEAHHLLLADVDQVVFKKPLKTPTYFRYIKFERDHLTNKIVVTDLFPYQRIDEYELPALFTAEHIEISGFHLSLFFTHPLLKRFIFNPESVTIYDSNIDNDTIKLLLGCLRIRFEKCCDIAPDLTVFSITKNCSVLCFICFSFDVIDAYFLSDLSNVFSSSKTPIDVHVQCDFEDLKQKFNDYNLPRYPANSLSTYAVPDVLNEVNEASIIFHVENVTEAEANAYLKPFATMPIGPKMTLFEHLVYEEELIIIISNEECSYTEQHWFTIE